MLTTSLSTALATQYSDVDWYVCEGCCCSWSVLLSSQLPKVEELEDAAIGCCVGVGDGFSSSLVGEGCGVQLSSPFEGVGDGNDAETVMSVGWSIGLSEELVRKRPCRLRNVRFRRGLRRFAGMRRLGLTG